MPLTLIVTDGVIVQDREQETIDRLSEAFLRWHGLAGNKFMIPNVIGHVQVIAKGRTYAGLKTATVAIVEWKVPSFAFTDRKAQQGYVAEATEIVHEISGGKLAKESIWVNVTHAVDGAWGIAGKALSNAELGSLARGGAP